MNTRELQQAIGARLKHARLERGITQAELGERIGVSRAIVANYETGRSAIPAVLLLQAAEICRTSLVAFDPRADDSALTRIIQTLYERPDALEFVDEVLRSFAPSQSLNEPAPARALSANDFPRVSERSHKDATTQQSRATTQFRPAPRRSARIAHRHNRVT